LYMRIDTDWYQSLALAFHNFRLPVVFKMLTCSFDSLQSGENLRWRAAPVRMLQMAKGRARQVLRYTSLRSVS
jgi:hypothetical protein